MGVLGRYCQPLKIKDGLKLGKQRDEEVLIRFPVSGGSVYPLEREAAEELQNDVVDIATECEVSPRVGQTQEQ